MNRIRTMAIGAAIAVPALVAAPSAWSQATAAHDMTVVQPDAVKWVDAPPLPGAKLAVVQGPLNEAVPFIYRLRFPDNYRVPAHWHPHSETVTVLSGTFKMGHGEKFDETKLTAVPAGGVVIIEPKKPHFALSVGETVVQVHGMGPSSITFVNPDEDPRKK